jgi:hypothetical protein
MEISNAITHEQGGSKCPKLGQLRTNFGSIFMNFGAMDS